MDTILTWASILCQVFPTKSFIFIESAGHRWFPLWHTIIITLCPDMSRPHSNPLLPLWCHLPPWPCCCCELSCSMNPHLTHVLHHYWGNAVWLPRQRCSVWTMPCKSTVQKHHACQGQWNFPQNSSPSSWMQPQGRQWHLPETKRTQGWGGEAQWTGRSRAT